MEESYRKNIHNIKQKLIIERNNKCQQCGKVLDKHNHQVHHIIPCSKGGLDDIDNLLLLCPECNLGIHNKQYNILEYQFDEFIKELLNKHPNYSNLRNYINIESEKIRPDLIFEKINKNKKQLFVAEINASSSFTKYRILNIVHNLIKYKEKIPNAKLVFITLGELPNKYVDIVKSNDIELWDINFIKNEFKDQITDVNLHSFNFIFKAILNVSEHLDNFEKLINELNNCKTGKDNWVEYQKLIGKILELLFCPPLNPPISQSNDAYKKNRRDFILPNYSKENDIWEFLRNRYSADFIVVDAKNSNKCITKQDVLQIANYLKKEGSGLFGIIIARKGLNSSSEYALRETWLHDHKMIIVLNDVDIEQMILEKKNGNDPTNVLLKKIEDFRLSI